MQGNELLDNAKNTQTFPSANCSEQVKSTAWPPSSPDLNRFVYHVWNKLKEPLYRKCRKLFRSLEPLQHRTENAWPLESQDTIPFHQPLTNGKDIQDIIKQNGDAILTNKRDPTMNKILHVTFKKKINFLNESFSTQTQLCSTQLI